MNVIKITQHTTVTIVRKPELDVVVDNQGSVVLFRLRTQAAEQWVEDNVDVADWQWIGLNAFAVDHRFAGDLVAGMVEAGLAVV